MPQDINSLLCYEYQDVCWSLSLQDMECIFALERDALPPEARRVAAQGADLRDCGKCRGLVTAAIVSLHKFAAVLLSTDFHRLPFTPFTQDPLHLHIIANMFASPKEWQRHLLRLDNHRQYRLLQERLQHVECAFEYLLRDFKNNRICLATLKRWVMDLYKASSHVHIPDSCLTSAADASVLGGRRRSWRFLLSDTPSQAALLGTRRQRASAVPTLLDVAVDGWGMFAGT